jgi:YHS domain-containing protein
MNKFGFVVAAVLLGILLYIPNPIPADGSSVALGGYCPISYLEHRRAEYGDVRYSSTFEKRRYHFVDKTSKEAFDRDPARYANAIRYDAWGAIAISLGKWSASDPKEFVVRHGALYLFADGKAKARFVKNPETKIHKADLNWKTMTAGK